MSKARKIEHLNTPKETESEPKPPQQWKANLNFQRVQRFQRYLMSWRPEPEAPRAAQRQMQSNLLGLPV
ncbi:hypothetical protein BDA96_01G494500 [Sorghum bicolor]|uniref:Uncharacterized protein n=1 Tax=Sorghum bicolor TaxID=4558 RepID=A0A921S6J5_SORBI|nr:hypothetical protein BDA96_01G494500 [Sorghum bicolor]